MVRILAAMGLLALVAGCAVEEGASGIEVARAAHASNERPYIQVVSMVNRQSDRAAHTALIINASQRVIYDPAGTFHHATMPERGDIHYGATDRMVDYYERYHARFSHFVHGQKIYVSADLAERVLRRAERQGPSPKMFCTLHTGQILKDMPEFAYLRTGFYPEALRKQIAAFPGVVDSYVYEDDLEKVVPTN